jgi:hypothetical protein
MPMSDFAIKAMPAIKPKKTMELVPVGNVSINELMEPSPIETPL